MIPRGGVAPASRRVMNLSRFLTQQGRRQRDVVALVWGERTWTWAALEARAQAFAAVLADHGVGKGDRVLVQSKNCNQMIESMFACWRVGAVWVPTNYRQTPEEVAYLGAASGASAMICHRDFPDHPAAARREAAGLTTVLSIGPSEFGEDVDALIEARRGVTVADAPVDHDDPCWIFFTSGTTGRPKGAVLTHGQMAFVVTNHLADLTPGATPATDASLVVAPLSHGAGIHLLNQVARGVKSVLPVSERLDADEIWSLVERWRVTNAFTVPTIVKLLTEHPSVAQHDHSSLRHVIYAGAPMYREDQKHALRTLGPVLVQYFGLGEVTGNITVLPAEAHSLDDCEARVGTCGYERTGMQVSIQDDAGRELGPGETGEICVCGPAVFAGYYDNPDATAKAFRDGFFRTGDLGHIDDEGFVYITGRASDMYISGGSNIYPREIEEKILTHPAIAEVAVLGMPDRTWGEIGVAVCVLRPDAALGEDDFLAWMTDKVARYKLPRRAFFWDELPKSGYGKITKKAVREGLIARGEMASSP